MNYEPTCEEECECEESPLEELKDALKDKQTESAELARSAKRCETEITELTSALGEIQQNVDAFAGEGRELRKDWSDAVRDWRCSWEAIRKALNCDAGPNCVQVKKCVGEVDCETEKLEGELCCLRAKLSGTLSTKFSTADHLSQHAKEAYKRLLVASIKQRINDLNQRVLEAAQYDTGELQDRPKVYAILESARELIAGSETLVTLCPTCEPAGEAKTAKGASEPPLFTIPATPEDYERELVAAFRDYEQKASTAALASDELAMAAARRDALEEKIKKRLMERKQYLLEATKKCELAEEPECDYQARQPEGRARATR